MMKGFSESGSSSIGAVVKSSLSVSKDFWHSSFQSKSIPYLVSWKSELTINEKFFFFLMYKQAVVITIPKKRLNLFHGCWLRQR